MVFMSPPESDAPRKLRSARPRAPSILVFPRGAFRKLKRSALPLRRLLRGLLLRGLLLRGSDALGEMRSAGLAVPLLEGLGLDLPLHEELGELAALGRALEGH